MYITVYVYDKHDGEYLYTDTGVIDDIINDISDDKDFTLTPPPDTSKRWAWVDGAWV